MKPPLSHRDFLKFSTVLPFRSRNWAPSSEALPAQQVAAPNFLFLLFDAFSASHASLYGYTRLTTSNLERIAGQAIVYHKHYLTSYFTSPSTASILTGTYP